MFKFRFDEGERVLGMVSRNGNLLRKDLAGNGIYFDTAYVYDDGMSNIEQMEDNLSCMRDFKPLSEEEQATIRRAQFALEKSDFIKRTGCHYCTGDCPMQIPIPDVFSACNEEIVYGSHDKGQQMYDKAVSKGGKASDCIKCMQCEGACPQHLPIASGDLVSKGAFYLAKSGVLLSYVIGFAVI